MCFTIWCACIVRDVHTCAFIWFTRDYLWRCKLSSLCMSVFFVVVVVFQPLWIGDEEKFKKNTHTPTWKKPTELTILGFNLHTVHILCCDTTKIGAVLKCHYDFYLNSLFFFLCRDAQSDFMHFFLLHWKLILSTVVSSNMFFVINSIPIFDGMSSCNSILLITVYNE